jgi:branched-chain amino acid aminotransferase
MIPARADWIWMDGRWVAWQDAKIHVLSHVVHYGSSVFEGIRCYDGPRGPAIFRLPDHLRRLYDSARVYRMEIRYTPDELARVHRDIVTKNGLASCYLRPIVYRGFDNLGVNPFGKPVEVAVAAFPWGQYLGPDALTKGVAACVSSWRRPPPNALPSWVKAGGHYASSQLIKMEAVLNGYAEGIALDLHGNVAEGSGQNVFLVRDGALYTPPGDASILLGVTRDSVIQLAHDLEIPVRVEAVPRDLLYTADELFFTGTAVEIAPITSIDKLPVGGGEVGPVTRILQRAFFELVSGREPDRHGWLTPVATGVSTRAAAAGAPRP